MISEFDRPQPNWTQSRQEQQDRSMLGPQRPRDEVNDPFFMASVPGDCHCLYCDRVTNVHPTRTRSTVCSQCIYSDSVKRDERREVEAGMRPWVVEFADGRRMPQAEREAAQARWDRWQAAVKAFNEARR